MKSFDRDACRILRADMEIALKTVADKHGIALNVGKMQFDASSIQIKVEASLVGAGGVVEDTRRRDFKMFCTGYGLAPTDLDRKFVVSGIEYQITGLNTNAHKMPVIARCNRNGKSFKFPPETVKRALAFATPLRIAS